MYISPSIFFLGMINPLRKTAMSYNPTRTTPRASNTTNPPIRPKKPGQKTTIKIIQKRHLQEAYKESRPKT